MTDIIVDKPHNMYLQTAINTGMVSLLSLLFVWCVYLLDSIKIYIDGEMNTFEKFLGASAFLSVTGYLAAAIFN